MERVRGTRPVDDRDEGGEQDFTRSDRFSEPYSSSAVLCVFFRFGLVRFEKKTAVDVKLYQRQRGHEDRLVRLPSFTLVQQL